jgi:hypothetical protein
MSEAEEFIKAFDVIKVAVTELLDNGAENYAILFALTEMTRQFAIQAGGPELLARTVEALLKDHGELDG